MTVASQANVLAIHDTVVRMLNRQGSPSVGTNCLLQGPTADSLNWSDSELEAFLTEQVPSKFGVVVQRQHIRSTINGVSPTIGDLSIAISNAIHRQYHPRKRW